MVKYHIPLKLVEFLVKLIKTLVETTRIPVSLIRKNSKGIFNSISNLF